MTITMKINAIRVHDNKKKEANQNLKLAFNFLIQQAKYKILIKKIVVAVVEIDKISVMKHDLKGPKQRTRATTTRVEVNTVHHRQIASAIIKTAITKNRSSSVEAQ